VLRAGCSELLVCMCERDIYTFLHTVVGLVGHFVVVDCVERFSQLAGSTSRVVGSVSVGMLEFYIHVYTVVCSVGHCVVVEILRFVRGFYRWYRRGGRNRWMCGLLLASLLRCFYCLGYLV